MLYCDKIYYYNSLARMGLCLCYPLPGCEVMMEDAFLRRYFYTLFGLYTLIGLYGTAWVMDGFDELRLGLVSFVTVPALCCFLYGFILDLQYWRKWPKVFFTLASIVVISLLWSQILLLNAVTSEESQVVTQNVATMALEFDARRGGFGWIYSTRW